MCDPLSVGIAGLVVGAVGTGVSVYSSKKQADAMNMASDYNKEMASKNAEIAEEKAKLAIEIGKVNEKTIAQNVESTIGTQQAGFAASGALASEGSAADVAIDTRILGAVDAMTARFNAAQDARGYRTQGLDYQAQSKLYEQSKVNTNLTMAGSLLGGISNLGLQAYQISRVK